MKKLLLLFAILSVSVMTTACINNLAIQELNNKALTYMDKGDAETAICRLKSSLELDDEVFQTHYNLAVAYNSLGKYEESINELNRVLEINPDFADALYTLAVAKEALATNVVAETLENGEATDLTIEQIEEYNNKASDAVETYNKYLIKKPDAKDAAEVNEKISELNSRIKEFTGIYENGTYSQEASDDEETPESEVIPDSED